MSHNVELKFGKHKGELLSDVPTDYLDWLLGEDWVREDLKEDILAHLETRADWKRQDY